MEALRVAAGTYVPHVRYEYPTDDPVTRLHRPVYDREEKFDENYPYVDDSLKMRLSQKLAKYFILPLIHANLSVVWGLKIEGREWLKKYQKELSHGCIQLANHCHRHDWEAIQIATGADICRMRTPMFAPNFCTKDAPFMKMAGGIPIPPAEEGLAAMKKFNAAFDTFNERGFSIHIFPEAAKWDFYKPLRPFQKGAFTMAYKYNKPLLPVVINYRERTGIYKWFGDKKLPLLTVRIGEPILPDTTQPRKNEVDRLLIESHKRMCQLAGITENPWPAQI